MAKNSLGRIGFVFKGDYNNSTTYAPMDVVYYEGSSYICIKETINNLPNNTEYWHIFSKQVDTENIEKKLELLESEFDINTVSGNSIHITDSAKAPMKISPRGNMEQDTREGYNLINTEDFKVSGTSKNVKANISSGNYTLNFYKSRIAGTTIGNQYLYGYTNIKFYQEDGTLLDTKTRANAQTLNDYTSRIEVFENITAPENTSYIEIEFSNNNGDNNVNTLVSEVMLVKGTYTKDTLPSFEQYGAMPSLDFPSPVKHVGGSVKSYNELDITVEPYKTQNVDIVEKTATKLRLKNNVTGENVYYFQIPKELKTGVTYTITRNFTVNSGTAQNITGNVELYKLNTSGLPVWVKMLVRTSATKATFTVDEEGIYYLRLALSANATDVLDVTFSNLMIYEGTEAKPYMPYNGYNELNNTATSQTVSGVTFTVNKDGSVIANGTATANINFKLMENFTLENDVTYTLCGTGKGSSQTTYGLLINQYYDSASHIEGDYGNGLQFVYNIASKSTNSIYIYIHNGVAVSNVVFKPMVVKGTSSKPYLPYGDIGSVYDIANINKNLFDKNKRDSLNSFYKTDGSIGTSSSSWYITNIKVKPNTNYYLSGNNFSNTTACTVLLDKNKKHIKTIGDYTNTHLIATTNDTAYIGLSIPIHSSIKDVDTLMLEEGNTATDYTPHQQENYSLDLTGLPLYSKNDYIYKIGDKWFVHNEYGKELLSGKLHQRIPTSNSSKFLYTINLDNALRMDNNKVLYAGYSNLLKSTTREDIFVNLTPGFAYSSLSSDYFGTGGLFYFDETAEMTLEETKAFIAEKGMYVVYPLATPTETEITDETVIEVCEALLNTESYKGVTNINSEVPTTLVAELNLDASYYISNAIRINNLEKAILSLGGNI